VTANAVDPGLFGRECMTTSRKRTQHRTADRGEIGSPVAIFGWLDMRGARDYQSTELGEVQLFGIEMAVPSGAMRRSITPAPHAVNGGCSGEAGRSGVRPEPTALREAAKRLFVVDSRCLAAAAARLPGRHAALERQLHPVPFDRMLS
jgi:hypothetical protein